MGILPALLRTHTSRSLPTHGLAKCNLQAPRQQAGDTAVLLRLLHITCWVFSISFFCILRAKETTFLKTTWDIYISKSPTLLQHNKGTWRSEESLHFIKELWNKRWKVYYPLGQLLRDPSHYTTLQYPLPAPREREALQTGHQHVSVFVTLAVGTAWFSG